MKPLLGLLKMVARIVVISGLSVFSAKAGLAQTLAGPQVQAQQALDGLKFFYLHGGKALPIVDCEQDFAAARSLFRLPPLGEGEGLLNAGEIGARYEIVPKMAISCKDKPWSIEAGYLTPDMVYLFVKLTDGSSGLATITSSCPRLVWAVGLQTLLANQLIKFRAPTDAESMVDLTIPLSCAAEAVRPRQDGWSGAIALIAPVPAALDVDTGADGSLYPVAQLAFGNFLLGVGSVNGVDLAQLGEPTHAAVAAKFNDLFRFTTPFTGSEGWNISDGMGLIDHDAVIGAPILALCLPSEDCHEGSYRHFYRNALDEKVFITNRVAVRTLSREAGTFGQEVIEWTFRESPRSKLQLAPHHGALIAAMGLKVVDRLGDDFEQESKDIAAGGVLSPAMILGPKPGADAGACIVSVSKIAGQSDFEHQVATLCGEHVISLTLVGINRELTLLNRIKISKFRFKKLQRLTIKDTNVLFKVNSLGGDDIGAFVVTDQVVLSLEKVHLKLEVASQQSLGNTKIYGLLAEGGRILLDGVTIGSLQSSPGEAAAEAPADGDVAPQFYAGIFGKLADSGTNEVLARGLWIEAVVPVLFRGRFSLFPAKPGSARNMLSGSNAAFESSGGANYLVATVLKSKSWGIKLTGSSAFVLASYINSDRTVIGGLPAGIWLNKSHIFMMSSLIDNFASGVRVSGGTASKMHLVLTPFCHASASSLSPVSGESANLRTGADGGEVFEPYWESSERCDSLAARQEVSATN